MLKLFGNTFLDLKILGGGGISDNEFKIQKMAVEEIETAIFLRSKPGNVANTKKQTKKQFYHENHTKQEKKDCTHCQMKGA